MESRNALWSEVCRCSRKSKRLKRWTVDSIPCRTGGNLAGGESGYPRRIGRITRIPFTSGHQASRSPDADGHKSITDVGQRTKAGGSDAQKALARAGYSEEEAAGLWEAFFALETEIAQASIGNAGGSFPDIRDKAYNPKSAVELCGRCRPIPAHGNSEVPIRTAASTPS